MGKLSELSFDEFLEAFKSKYSELWSAAVDAGTTDEVLTKVVESNYNTYKDMSVTRVMTKTKADVDFYTTDKIRGCIIGSSDKFDSKSPVRYIMLKQDKHHVELSNFGHTTAYGDEPEYTIPVPSLITVRAKFDQDFNTWNLASIETIENAELTRSNLIKVCDGVAIEPKRITQDMAWTRGKTTVPIVIKGKISGISPEVVFTRDDEDRAKVSDTFNIYEPDESGGMQPCFNFRLASPGGKFVRCHLKKQRYGKPTLDVDNLVDRCRSISAETQEPQKQCDKLFNEWFKDVDVFVVGTVSSYKETFGQDQKATTNVEVTVFAVIEIPEDRVSGDVTQTTILKEEKPEPKTKPKKPPVEKKEQPVEKKEQPVEKKEQPVEKKGSEKTDMAAVIHDLKIYCEAADISPDELSLDVIKSRALDRFEDIPEGVLISAIMAVKENGK